MRYFSSNLGGCRGCSFLFLSLLEKLESGKCVISSRVVHILFRFHNYLTEIIIDTSRLSPDRLWSRSFLLRGWSSLLRGWSCLRSGSCSRKLAELLGSWSWLGDRSPLLGSWSLLRSRSSLLRYWCRELGKLLASRLLGK